MTCVLGIDPAWTEKNPSGVALVAKDPGWRLVAVESSYERFVARAAGSELSGIAPAGSKLDAAQLIEACERLARAPDVVAVDMPLAKTDFVTRRESDNAVSRAYGRYKCGTHSPTETRPGKLSAHIRDQFDAFGYRLRTSVPVARGIIEVYPHPALIELMQAKVRVPYKLSRARMYWPELTEARERNERLVSIWRQILTMLERRIANLAALLTPPGASATTRDLKAFEDKLDAVICAWVGICAFEGRAVPLGDGVSAIWVPAGGR